MTEFEPTQAMKVEQAFAQRAELRHRVEYPADGWRWTQSLPATRTDERARDLSAERAAGQPVVRRRVACDCPACRAIYGGLSGD